MLKRINKLNILITFYGGLTLCAPLTYLAANPDQESEKTVEQSIQERYIETAETSGAIIFNPPEGWGIADPKMLPPSVEVMVIGKGAKEFPPSMSLATEPWPGTLKEYLKRVKAINEARKDPWKDLGMIKTGAGIASLSQVESRTKWGNTKEMHLILLRDGTIYILSAAALKEEFPKFYKEFFHAFRSLRFNKTTPVQSGLDTLSAPVEDSATSKNRPAPNS